MLRLVIAAALAIGACGRAGDGPTSAADEPAEPAATATPAYDEPDPDDGGVTIELSRPYDPDGDDRPVRLRLVPPQDWVQRPDRPHLPPAFLPPGETSTPSITLTVALDHLEPEALTAALDERLAQERAQAADGGAVTVLDEREIPGGGAMLVRRVASGEAARAGAHIDVLCYLRRPADTFVTLVHGRTLADEAGARRDLELACARARVLGPTPD